MGCLYLSFYCSFEIMVLVLWYKRWKQKPGLLYVHMTGQIQLLLPSTSCRESCSFSLTGDTPRMYFFLLQTLWSQSWADHVSFALAVVPVTMLILLELPRAFICRVSLEIPRTMLSHILLYSRSRSFTMAFPYCSCMHCRKWLVLTATNSHSMAV